MIDDIAAMIGLNIEDVFRRWTWQNIATHVIQERLRYVVQIRLHAHDMSFRRFDGLARFEHS